MSRCVATNPAGARCLYDSVHGNSGHLWGDDPHRYPFLLGKLQGAVEGFLVGRVDRDWLARVHAEVEEAS